MYSKKLIQDIEGELESLKKAGKFKVERELEGAQGPEVEIGAKKVLMFASNNYLGLANHPEIVKAGKKGGQDCAQPDNLNKDNQFQNSEGHIALKKDQG